MTSVTLKELNLPTSCDPPATPRLSGDAHPTASYSGQTRAGQSWLRNARYSFERSEEDFHPQDWDMLKESGPDENLVAETPGAKESAASPFTQQSRRRTELIRTPQREEDLDRLPLVNVWDGCHFELWRGGRAKDATEHGRRREPRRARRLGEWLEHVASVKVYAELKPSLVESSVTQLKSAGSLGRRNHRERTGGTPGAQHEVSTSLGSGHVLSSRCRQNPDKRSSAQLMQTSARSTRGHGVEKPSRWSRCAACHEAYLRSRTAVRFLRKHCELRLKREWDASVGTPERLERHKLPRGQLLAREAKHARFPATDPESRF